MSNLNVKNRTVFNKDNLDVLRGINSNSIDLIYLDPPFNKKKVFTAPIGSSAEGAEFNDIFRKEDIKDEWVSGIAYENLELHSYLSGVKFFSSQYNYCYLVYIAIRLIECRRILKETGSIYLHCDPTMSHYLKVVLDCIFGEKHFLNEIVWSYKTGGSSNKLFSKKHDIILFYSKNSHYAYNTQKEKAYTKSKNRRAGIINYGAGRATFFEDEQGVYNWVNMRDVWDISYIGSMDIERTGYPTQKPLALLERIIQASSNEGDVVLDPFCGCATTCVAAEKLGRQWIGVDVSYKAFELVKERLTNEIPDDLWDGKKELIFSTTPPTKDSAITDEERGFVYIISNPAFAGVYKVGIAKNVKQRLNAYQTSDPNRGYKIEREYKCSNYIEVEKLTHINFDGDREHEWVRAKLADIIDFIESKIEA